MVLSAVEPTIILRFLITFKSFLPTSAVDKPTSTLRFNKRFAPSNTNPTLCDVNKLLRCTVCVSEQTHSNVLAQKHSLIQTSARVGYTRKRIPEIVSTSVLTSSANTHKVTKRIVVCVESIESCNLKTHRILVQCDSARRQWRRDKCTYVTSVRQLRKLKL
jgi:hypothetical protein